MATTPGPTQVGASSMLLARVLPMPVPSARRASLLVERTLLVYRRGWLLILSGFFEPLFYLLSIGIGALVGTVVTGSGVALEYTVLVAPALMASSAMNGAVYDSTFNIFFKLKYAKLYDAVLSTPLSSSDVAAGETTWALMRGSLYSTAFLTVMLALGLVESWWAILAVPACSPDRVRLRRGRSGCDVIHEELAELRVRSAGHPADVPVLDHVLPAFGLPGRAPSPRPVHAALSRHRTGVVDPWILGHVLYLLVMGGLGLIVGSKRLATLLLK